MSKKLENKVIEGKTQNKGGRFQNPYYLIWIIIELIQFPLIIFGMLIKQFELSILCFCMLIYASIQSRHFERKEKGE